MPTTARRAPGAPSGPLGFIVDPALDAQRRRDLRRMRLVATGLLVFAAIVYVLTRGHDDGVLGFVNAGAEASMVGACADWFAVTAIFRHPLGLPIPHTALIPRKKEMIGRSLEEFVSENFMREDIIRERVLDAEPTRRAAEWALAPGHAKRLVDEVATVTVHALHRIPDEDVRAVIEQAVLPRLAQEPISSLAGGLLDQVVRDEAHVGLVDLALDEIRAWLVDNEDLFESLITQRAPAWVPDAINDLVARKIHVEALKWLADIRNDPRPRRAPGARQAAHRPRRRPPARPRHPGQGGAAQGAACCRTRRWPTRRCRCGARCAPSSSRRSRTRAGPVRARAVREVTALAERLLADAAAARPHRHPHLRRDDLCHRPLRHRADPHHQRHRRPVGRQGDRRARRAPGGPRPAVHPHQRHPRGWPHRHAHPRRLDPAALLSARRAARWSIHGATVEPVVRSGAGVEPLGDLRSVPWRSTQLLAARARCGGDLVRARRRGRRAGRGRPRSPSTSTRRSSSGSRVRVHEPGRLHALEQRRERAGVEPHAARRAGRP